MTPHQSEILHLLKTERGKTFTAVQIRRRCPSISPSLAPETLAKMLETTPGVTMTDPPRLGQSGRPVLAARWGLTR